MTSMPESGGAHTPWPASPELLDKIERILIDCGAAGANADLNHPLRKLWEASRNTLMDAGRLDGRGIRERA